MEPDDEWTMHLEHKSGDKDLWAFESTYRFSLNTPYYVSTIRVGNDYRLKVYSDSNYSNLLEDSENIQGASDRYRYIWLSSTLNTKKNQGNRSSGYIQNFQRMT
jgi:hypothetical protein